MSKKLVILLLFGIAGIQKAQTQTVSIRNLKREGNAIISDIIPINNFNQNGKGASSKNGISKIEQLIQQNRLPDGQPFADQQQFLGSDSFFPAEFVFPDLEFDNQFTFTVQSLGLGSNDLFGPNCPLPRRIINGECTCELGYLFIKDRCLFSQKGQTQKKAYRQKFKKITRNIDGSGNNRQHSDWGSVNSTMGRLALPSYTDGVYLPPNYRPNPRVISNQVGKMTGQIIQNRLKLTNIFTIWGQFVDHDITLTPTQKEPNAQDMSIPVPKGDPNFDPTSTGNKKLTFSRSIFQANSSPRQQKNVITAWLDGSQVYGSDEATSLKLRTFTNGQLKTSAGNLMPKIEESGQFLAGDIRANQNMILASLHTIFVRQHNRLAKIIKKSDSNLEDEQIFQLSRLLVIAYLSKITFDDWLPTLIGPSIYQNYIGQYKGYNSNENPNVISQFSSAAFRFGHSLLVDEFPFIDKNGKTVFKMELPMMFFNPRELQNEQNMENLLRGVTKSVSKERSNQLVDSIRNFLITDHQKKVMMDLYSLNIQRGRDHGVQDYNTIRETLGYSRIKTFFELGNDHNVAQKLSGVYININNLDLWVGIICETAEENGVLGKVGATIVANQLRKIRDADRFWYQNIFPKQILRNIKRTTLADIIKRNTDIKDLQKDIFRMP